MNYVMHFCRNKQCNNGWIDKDLTNAKSTPPSWKYCEDCCKELGIDFDSQTPTSNLTEKELKEYQRKVALANANAEKRKTLNFRPQNRGNLNTLPPRMIDLSSREQNAS